MQIRASFYFKMPIFKIMRNGWMFRFQPFVSSTQGKCTPFVFYYLELISDNSPVLFCIVVQNILPPFVLRSLALYLLYPSGKKNKASISQQVLILFSVQIWLVSTSCYNIIYGFSHLLFLGREPKFTSPVVLIRSLALFSPFFCIL